MKNKNKVVKKWLIKTPTKTAGTNMYVNIENRNSFMKRKTPMTNVSENGEHKTRKT